MRGIAGLPSRFHKPCVERRSCSSSRMAVDTARVSNIQWRRERDPHEIRMRQDRSVIGFRYHTVSSSYTTVMTLNCSGGLGIGFGRLMSEPVVMFPITATRSTSLKSIDGRPSGLPLTWLPITIR